MLYVAFTVVIGISFYCLGLSVGKRNPNPAKKMPKHEHLWELWIPGLTNIVDPTGNKRYTARSQTRTCMACGYTEKEVDY